LRPLQLQRQLSQPTPRLQPRLQAATAAAATAATSAAVAAEAVELSMISGPEGLAFWAFHAEDLSSRSAFSQRFQRALAKDPQAMNMWKDLSDDLKLKFKASWGIQWLCW
jgi:hypothetical protein